MAEIILTPIADTIIQTLGSRAVQKMESLYSVRDDLKTLGGTLEAIRAVLLDAEKQQSSNKQVRLWLQRLEDVVDDADDLVDGVSTEGIRRLLMPARFRKLRIFFSSYNQILLRHKMAKEIRSVRKRLDAISADRRDFSLEVRSRDEVPRTSRRSGRETHSLTVDENVVGRAGEEKAVLKLLLEDETEERVRVVPITGMGGLGKTTLARIAFNDDGVQKHFDAKIWVCVSDEFEEKAILGSMIRSIDGASAVGRPLEELQITLREKMQGKRYLLVLDDVWNENRQKWESLMGVLSNCGESGSKVIVTTRSRQVAWLTSNAGQPFHLGVLSEEDSWLLFEKMAFRQGREPDDQVNAKAIGKAIVMKCGGIPLAIRMIASMLSFRDPETEWATFLKKELSSLPQQEGDILPTLKLSYDCLPSHLKHCFAYCSLFPKDHVIDVDTLVDLWITQGFISVSSGRSQALEDAGYDHFSELFWRSFFQEVQIDGVTNKVVACKMHDLVNDLAIKVAGERYASLDLGREGNKVNEKARHISSAIEVPCSSRLQTERLRSFLHSSENHFAFGELTAEAMVSNFKFLRMLDLHGSGIEIVPDSIGNLKHLRYLDLSGNDKIEALPSSLTKLVNLQTLKLNDCTSLRELPTYINKLVNLKNLQFSRWSNDELNLPRGVSRLTNLQTFSYFKLAKDPALATSQLDELTGLNRLRGKLEIRGLASKMETKGANLKGKEHIQSLWLQWKQLSSDDESTSADGEPENTLEGLQPHLNLRELVVIWYDGVRFFNWLSSLTNLVSLCLEGNKKCQQLPSLDQLCSLKKLSLFGCTELECIITETGCNRNFPTMGALPAPVSVYRSLQQLDLLYLPNFRGWQSPNIRDNTYPAEEFPSYFPRLTNLTIDSCPKLTSMPLYPNVKELKLRNSNRKPFEKTVSLSIAHEEHSSSKTFFPLFLLGISHLLTRSTADLQHFPDWVRSLPHLETLRISGNERSQLEPQCMTFEMGMINFEIEEGDERETSIAGNRIWETFSSIRELILLGVSTLKHVSQVFQYLNSLNELRITSCEELEFASDGNETVKWEALTSLRTLVLSFLPKLVALPVELQRVTALQDLRLLGCDNLTAIPDWICNLSSLQKLQIESCQMIESLPGSISKLASLQRLEINLCPVFSLERCDGSDDDCWIEWEALTSLRTLVLSWLPKLVTLPKELQRATTLQFLELNNCCNLIALPDWINELVSLQELAILFCPVIESLPGSIRSLASMQCLRIFCCPILSQKCQRQTGEDWPKIQHIPNIVIN